MCNPFVRAAVQAAARRVSSSYPLCLVVLSFLLLCCRAGRANAQSASEASAGANVVVTISGVVSEAISGESVIGVNVLLLRDSAAISQSAASVKSSVSKPVGGARTNKFGFYSIANVPQGSYLLVVRGIGYKPFVRRVKVESEARLNAVRQNIQMELQDVRSQEITVEGARDVSPTRDISAVTISTEFAKKMPTLGGESDIFRTLQLLPGIKAGSEVSSGLYVRGGSPDQNLVLLDGVIVYNPSHLGGFLSTFNSDAIRDVRVIKGAFPAEYGGRLSSVIDLTMKEGSKEKISGAGNISLIASRLTIEGPITEDLTFMVSGRRTYFDLLIAAATANQPSGTIVPNYYFYDLNAKVNYKISENDRLFASGYFGRDVFTAGSDAQNQRVGIDWGNATANLRWTHVVSPSLFTNFSAIYTDYKFSSDLAGGGNFSFNSLSQIRDFMLRGDAQWFPTQQHVVKAGVEATFHQFRTLVSSNNDDFNAFLANSELGLNTTIPSLEAALYVQDEWTDAFDVDGLSLNGGLRLAYFQQGARVLPEPRLSAAYTFNTEAGLPITLKGAFAVANQFLHLVVRNDLALPTDAWFPSTAGILPANSTQYVLGAETKLFNNEVLVSVEGYYKSMRNLLEFKDNATFSLFAPREQDLTRGVGEAYGVELFINKQIGAFTGWIGYTLSWTTRTFADLNNGKPFFPRYDSRNDVSVTFNYKFSDAWELGASWVFQSGQAYTMPSGQFIIDPGVAYQPTSPTGAQTSLPFVQAFSRGPYSLQLYTERNGFRLPPFHKLDVNFTHYFRWFDLPFNVAISVYNVYNRRNPFAWVIDANKGEVVQYTLFPIIPTLSLGFKF
jgi:hypothetical protein